MQRKSNRQAPPASEEPNGDEAVSSLSWLYDDVTVESVEYTGETVVIEVDGRPTVIAKAATPKRYVPERKVTGTETGLIGQDDDG